MSFSRKKAILLAACLCMLVVLYQLSTLSDYHPSALFPGPRSSPDVLPIRPHPTDDGKFYWANVPQHYPVTATIPLPSGPPTRLPKIQHTFPRESQGLKKIRIERLAAVKESFTHAWEGYKAHAWLRDEVGPLSGISRNTFGGWAATLVDALDTLWIMDMKNEFEIAVDAVRQIDFTKTDEQTLNTFETTIRYLGGFLAAYDLSDGKYPVLLEKAIELGEMLYVAFDTPNRMPITRWDWKSAAAGQQQEASDTVLLAELGSLSLEFTRLSQISKDPRYFDAIQRITDEFDKQQETTKLPGMFPVVVNARDMDFGSDSGYTLGAMADSFYEYLPKEYMLLGGRSQQYRKVYERAADVFTRHNFYRPMTKEGYDILVSGLARADGSTAPILEPSCQHLVCYAGGMMGIAAKIFDRADDLSVARKLVDGCIWAYQSIPTGMMAEVSHLVPCDDALSCPWDEAKWHGGMVEGESIDETGAGYQDHIESKIRDERLPPGYTRIDDRRYILRPEAIESVFILYRITGEVALQDQAWKMFSAISNHTRTAIAHAALDDITVTIPPKADRMESFWLGETLKYFYLIFADPDLISLDKYVLNTEAHPFKRP